MTTAVPVSADRKRETDVLFLIWSDGIGDTMAATPTIRYFCEQFGTEAGPRKVDVWTRRPEVFKYNPNVAKIHHGFDPDVTFLSQWPLINIKRTFFRANEAEKIRHYHSPLVDYCSVCALEVVLPEKHRHFQVPWGEAEAARAQKLLDHPDLLSSQTHGAVVLHASDTWKTRRMPAETWEALAQKLVDNGVKVFVVGKDIPDRYPLKLLAMPGVANMVNKLDLMETVALMNVCDVVVTMDAGSICMAGCTPETRIVAVLTVNPPEFRAPWRKGSWAYKLRLANNTPDCIYCGVHLDRIDKNLSNCINTVEPMCCLPEPDRLAEIVLEEVRAEVAERCSQ